jgi:hypothetical protein
MRWRALALVSLGVNLLLAAVWLLWARRAPGNHSAATAGVGPPIAGQGRTNLVVRRQYFSWREIESPDYTTYIANLRDIGCPEQTIRDIIIADVNALYARKRATDIITPDQQWWRSEPDQAVLQAAAEKLSELENERRALLGRLLGTNWETGDLVSLPRPSRSAILLDGPVLGDLPTDTKEAIQEVNAHSQDRLNAYLAAQQREGKEPDPVELAKLRQETRTELQRYLTPLQLEEYLLRYSQDANNLRVELGHLHYFNATPDEFRAIFRATDAIEQRIELLAGNDPTTVMERQALEDQRADALKLALGAKRYDEYQSLHDPLYRDAVAIADEAGTPDAAGTIYAINLASAAEQQSIRANTNLTDTQRQIELKNLELQKLQANAVATDQELPPEPAPQPQPTPRKVYVLGPGDSAATVSMIYGVPVSALRAANPGMNLNRLRPGDTLNIPPNPLFPQAGP